MKQIVIRTIIFAVIACSNINLINAATEEESKNIKLLKERAVKYRQEGDHESADNLEKAADKAKKIEKLLNNTTQKKQINKKGE